ncbi:UNVERIFIED_ORG: hypothetical protein FHR35_001657 [Microbispora rosea subsp. rosea]
MLRPSRRHARHLLTRPENTVSHHRPRLVLRRPFHLHFYGPGA